MATQLDLHTAEKPESQDLCLIEAHGSMQTFLDQYIETHPGEIVDQGGNILGHHQGVHHFTIGQRRGIGVAAPHPLYVVDLDPGKNRVIVGDRETALKTECMVKRVNWVSIAPPKIRFMLKFRFATGQNQQALLLSPWMLKHQVGE